MGTWKSTTVPLPQGRASLQAWAYKGRLYVCGGKTGTLTTYADKNILAARYDHAGDIGPWEIVGQLPTQLVDAGVFIDPRLGQVFLDSGFDPGHGFAEISKIQVLRIATDGKIQSLSAAPSPRGTFAAFTWLAQVGNFIYDSGYNTPAAPEDRYAFVAPYSSDGSLGPWVRTLDVQGDMIIGAMGACRGVVVVIHEKDAPASGNYGNVAFPCQIDWARPASSGAIDRWNTLTSLFPARGGEAAVGVKTGVLITGGYQTTDNTIYTELKEAWLVPVGTDQ